MHTAEDLESMENLHALCSLMQTIRASCEISQGLGLLTGISNSDVK
jgi:hypothetical protein